MYNQMVHGLGFCFSSFSTLPLHHFFSDELFDSGSRSFKTPQEQLAFLSDSLRADPRDFFLVFHNIDGVNLRKEKTQQVRSGKMRTAVYQCF